MTKYRSIADIRRDYGQLSLDEHSIKADPLEQFKLWFEEVLANEPHDPTAMVLSTIDEQGYPDSRVVLLKGLDDGTFIFYTNYQSAKAKQLEGNAHAALNFYWPHMARQVRIRGVVNKVPTTLSDSYFASRPTSSQLGAIISPQSQKIKDRHFLDIALDQLMQNQESPLTRPVHWGGYQLTPNYIEFWQGRDNRLHDRIAYTQQDKIWLACRLAP